MTIRNKLALVATFGVGALPVLAQEAQVSIDTQAAEDAVGAVGTAISDLLKGTVLTNVLLVVGAGLAIGLVFLGVRYLLRGGKTSAK